MATSIYNIQEVLEIGYKVENQELVGQFLNENPFLVPLLDLVKTNIELYFPDANLTLEVLNDPEIPNYVQLGVFIYSDFELEEAIDRLHNFDHSWWIKNSPLAQNKLLIDIR